MAHNPARYTAAGRRGRLPDATIVCLYRETGSTEAVALKAGCSSQCVRDILRRQGEPIAGRGGHKQTFDLSPEQMAALYQDGLSLFQISRKAGCSPSTCRNRLRECGIVLRPNSWANSTRRSHDRQAADDDD